MTKHRIYLRITQRGLVKASTKPNYYSLPDDKYSKPQPTLLFAIDLDIDEKEFESTRILLEAKINNPKPAIEIREGDLEKEKEKKKK